MIPSFVDISIPGCTVVVSIFGCTVVPTPSLPLPDFNHCFLCFREVSKSSAFFSQLAHRQKLSEIFSETVNKRDISETVKLIGPI